MISREWFRRRTVRLAEKWSSPRSAWHISERALSR